MKFQPFPILLILFFLLPQTSRADVWEAVDCAIYFSNDRRHFVKIVPACIQAIESKKRRKRQVPDSCSGIGYQRRAPVAIVYSSDLPEHPLYYFNLVNALTPAQAFLSNDGKVLVTIDDWGGRGTSREVLALYREGKRINNYALPEISPVSVDEYYRSISSIHWFGGLEFSNDKLIISFRTRSRDTIRRSFNLADCLIID